MLLDWHGPEFRAPLLVHVVTLGVWRETVVFLQKRHTQKLFETELWGAVDGLAVTSILITLVLVWMFFQIAWVGSRTLDRKMLRDVEAPADHVRREQRSVFFTFVVLGTGTMAFTYVVGIASSWSAEELQKMGSGTLVERPLGISGSVLFSGSLFLFALFTMILFGAHFRSKAPSSAEILADVKALDSSTARDSLPARIEQLKAGMSASRSQFRKRWHTNALDRNFYIHFMQRRDQKPFRRADRHQFVAVWLLKKKTWIPFTVACFLLALAVLITTVIIIAQTGAPFFGGLVLVALALVFALSLVGLQVACAYAELRFLAADLHLELGRYKSATARLAALAASPTDYEVPPSVRAQHLVLALGPLQIWSHAR